MRALACLSPISHCSGARTHSAEPPGMTIIFLFFFFLPTNTKWSQTGSIAFYVEEDDDSRLPEEKDELSEKGSPHLPHSGSFTALPRCLAGQTRQKKKKKRCRGGLSNAADTMWEEARTHNHRTLMDSV